MKTKALISFAGTAKLICVFVFAYAESRFSQDVAHIICTVYTHKETQVKFDRFIETMCQCQEQKKNIPHVRQLDIIVQTYILDIYNQASL